MTDDDNQKRNEWAKRSLDLDENIPARKVVPKTIARCDRCQQIIDNVDNAVRFDDKIFHFGCGLLALEEERKPTPSIADRNAFAPSKKELDDMEERQKALRKWARDVHAKRRTAKI